MSIETMARAGMASILAAHSDLGVTVEYGSQSTTALRVLTDKQTDPGEFGQAGSILSTVRVSSAAIDEPQRGAFLVVGGVQVNVLNCRTSGGIRVIQCSDTQPVEGI